MTKIYKNLKQTLTALKNFNSFDNTFHNKCGLKKTKDKGFESKQLR